MIASLRLVSVGGNNPDLPAVDSGFAAHKFRICRKWRYDLGVIERRMRPLVVEALRDTRVVMVMGARQVGKSTLCQAIAAEEHPATSVSLDDQGARETAQADPAGFLAGFDGPVFIDEVQRAPELILAIKQVVDREQRPGQFLLTGSANILSSRKVHETLAGRIELTRLWPFAQAELEDDGEGNLVDALFAASNRGRAYRQRRVRLQSRRRRLPRGPRAHRPAAGPLVLELSRNDVRTRPACDRGSAQGA
ncbi:MAG: ATP-binding protein [Solirubrobacteraceae bacterium]